MDERLRFVPSWAAPKIRAKIGRRNLRVALPAINGTRHNRYRTINRRGWRQTNAGRAC